MGLPLDSPIRDNPPCYGCTEKFILCHGDCPKDNRGEYGYLAWKADIEKANNARREYDRTHYNKYQR
jgi:hypothetical protein